jgi:hypothetical protein
LRPEQPGLAALHEAQLTLGTPPLRAMPGGAAESEALGANAVSAAATWTPGRIDVGAFALQGEAGVADASGHSTPAPGGAAVRAGHGLLSHRLGPALRCAMSGTARWMAHSARCRAVESTLEGTVNDHPRASPGAGAPDGALARDGLGLASGANTLAPTAASARSRSTPRWSSPTRRHIATAIGTGGGASA